MIGIIQHVPYESPGWIINWLKSRRVANQLVDIYKGDPLPALEEISGLILMGGSMNVYEEKLHPWLIPEKEFIRRCIGHGKQVLGICLGAQLVATCLGAKVKRNAALEIGWYPLKINESRLPERLKEVFPEEFTTFHWHGDTFETPVGARSFASSEATDNQGFTFGDNILAIQFHPEITGDGIEDLINHDTDDLFSESLFIQNVAEMRQGKINMDENKKIMFDLLESFFRKRL